MNQLKNILNFRFIRSFYISSNKLEAAGASAARIKKKSEQNIEEIIPSKPAVSKIDLGLLPPRTVIDANTISLLERLSLVDCANQQSVRILEDAIQFADQILQVNTEGVQPLITVLEDLPLQIREDKVEEGNIRDDILSNAAITEEEYLVAPPGNIPWETNPENNPLHEVAGEISVDPMINTDQN